MRLEHTTLEWTMMDWGLGIRIGAAMMFMSAALWIGLSDWFSVVWQAAGSVEALGDLIRSWGNWGVAASTALMVISAASPFPAEIVALANGAVYGQALGLVITWTSGMLGALLTFGLSRWIGRPFTRHLLGRRLRKWTDEWADVESGTALLLARFIPIIPFCLLNYGAGQTNMKWQTFTWATGLGILPLTIFLSIAGDLLGTLHWLIWFVVLAQGLVLWLLLHRRTSRPITGTPTHKGDE